MEKGIRRVVLLLCLAAIALAAQTAAAENQPEAELLTEVRYEVPGGYLHFDGATGNITSYSGEITSANIPAQIYGVAVTSIGTSAFENCKSLTSVSIPGNITSIGNEAFNGCASLPNVSIPGSSVTSIGYSAFYGWMLPMGNENGSIAQHRAVLSFADMIPLGNVVSFPAA